MKQKMILTRHLFVVLLSILFCSFTAFAQSKLTGKVVDANSQPIPGVTVLVKNTNSGAVTDFDGNFEIANPTKGNILVFSYIGMETQEVAISNQTNFSVTMSEDITGLDEVVVIGYGSVKKSDLTGSVSSVSAKELNLTVNQSFGEALDGRAAGVKIESGEGSPGGDISIRVRGGTSISASNEPLYVIDGFPIIVEKSVGGSEDNASTSSNALAGIDPNDIESIQILKDASATAIYGSRGANGVIIITTKRGKVGKATVTVQTSLTTKRISKTIPVLDEVQYAQYRKDQNIDNPTNEIYLRFENPESFRGTGTNWQDEIYRTAVLRNFSLGIQGGSKEARYNVTLGAFLDEGIIKTSSFDRYNGRINLNGDISPRFRYAASFTSSFTKQNGAPTGGANGSRAGAVTQSLFYPPVIPSFDDAANNDLVGADQFNPVIMLNNSFIENKSDLFLGNLSLEYDILPELTFKTLVGANTRNVRNASFFNNNTYGALFNGRAQLQHIARRSWLNENTLTFKKQFNKHTLTVLAGLTAQSETFETFTTRNNNFDLQDLGFNNIGLGTSPEIPTSNFEKATLASGLARINYDYDQKYLLTLSYRADGSSRFANGEKWGYFPSAAVAWKVNNENFLKNAKAISTLKLRAGYGVTGNQEIPRYRALSSLGSGIYSFGIDNGNADIAVFVDRVSNPDLTWELTKQVNLGLDFGFFKNRISGSVDVYEKKTTDMLLGINLIPTTGISTPALQNVGSLQNRGLEIALRTINVSTKDFTWSTDFNISFNKNKVLDLGPYEELFFDAPGGTHTVRNEVILKPGQAIGTFYGFETAGIHPLPENPTPEEQSLAGSRIFVDQLTEDTDGDGIPDTADGVINDDDRVILGSALPKHYGGITNTFRYKDFDLNMFWNWSYGNKVYNANRVYLEEYLFDARNKSTDVINAWTPDNQNTDIAALDKSDAQRFMSRHIEDGSFLRLKSVSIGYTLKNDFIKGSFSSARIYASAQNLLTITNYSGYNPEANISNNPVVSGIDWGAYPLAQMFTFGINLKF